jgi:UDP-N-acetylmuramoylalanine--D-glutamate ligase
VEIGGNYGIPLLDLWDNFFAEKTDYVVAELSSYQLENLKVSPHFAIFLNFFPDHLDRHLNLKNYWNAKANLWKHQNSRDFLIIPETIRDVAKDIETTARIIFAEQIPAKFFAENSVFQAEHWLDNFGTIQKLANTLKLENVDKLLKKTAKNFAGLPHRMEFFAEKEGIKFYDDSISTNPDSTLASVNFFAKNLGAILLGGQDRKQNFTKLLKRLKELETLVIVLPTESRENLLKTIVKVGLTNFVDIEKWNGFEKIVEIVFNKIGQGAINRAPTKDHICLLSCAAPSYDIFKNFIDRGKQFKQAVRLYETPKIYCNSPLN